MSNQETLPLVILLFTNIDEIFPLMVVTILWKDAFFKIFSVLVRLKLFDFYLYPLHGTLKFLFNEEQPKQQIEWSNLRKHKSIKKNI